MDKSIGRQTMIFKVSWQAGFLLLVVRWVSSQTGFIVDKSGLTRQNSVCCWWTVPSQDSWRLCLICSCKRDGMTEYVGKQPCLVKDRMLCRQTSLMTGKSCFFIKSVLTRQKVVTALSCDGRVVTAGWQFSWQTSLMTDKSHDRQVSWQTSLMTDKSCFLVKSVLTRLKGVNSPVLGKAGCYCRQTSLMTDKSFLFGQVWVDHSERVNSPVSWQKGCFCRQSLVSWLVTVEPLLFREIRIYSGLSWHVSI